MKISIIIPVLNEEKELRRTLTSLLVTKNEELIIVDGGSKDRTVDIAKEFTSNVYQTVRGRAHQMNYGAREAAGDLLLFFHSDCVLPRNAYKLIRETLSDGSVSAGAFDLSIDHDSFCYRIIEKGANIRSRVTSIPYGDQGLFLSKDLFVQIGGYPDIPIMEDIAIAKELRQAGRIRFLKEKVKTSPRRWIAEGPVFTTMRDWMIALLYGTFNVPPDKLSNFYRDVR